MLHTDSAGGPVKEKTEVYFIVCFLISKMGVSNSSPQTCMGCIIPEVKGYDINKRTISIWINP